MADTLDGLLSGLQMSPDDERKRQGFGLLAAAAQLMGARRGREGQALGSGLMSGMQEYQQYGQDQLNQRLKMLQAKSAGMDFLSKQQQYNDAQAQIGLRDKYFTPPQPGMPPMGPPDPQGGMQPAVPPQPEHNDMQGYQAALMRYNPQAAMAMDPMVRRMMMRDAQATVPAGGAPTPPAPAQAMPPQSGMPPGGAPAGPPMPPQQGAGMPPQPSGPPITKANSVQQYVQQQLGLIQAYRKMGLFDEANQLQEGLIKLMPQTKPENVIARGPDGKPRYVILDNQGNATESNVAPAEKLHFGNLGNVLAPFDQYTGARMGAGAPIAQSADSRASTAASYAHLAETSRHNQMIEGDPATVEATAQGIANGNLAPLSGFALGRPMGQAVMARVMQLKPDYQAKDFVTSQKAEKDFATGKQGNTVRSFNVALTHLDTLGKLGEALNNKDLKLYNQVANVYKDQTGQAAPSNFNAAKEVVANEIVKAIVGSGGGVGDREKAQQAVNAAKSQDQLNGVISTYKELMQGQLGGLRLQYEQSTGKKDFDRFLSPGARATAAGGGGGSDVRKRADEILQGK